jgi:hypothetical protein
MVMLVMIFAAKKLPKRWCLGIDVFADFDKDNYENNFGLEGGIWACNFFVMMAQ